MVRLLLACLGCLGLLGVGLACDSPARGAADGAAASEATSVGAEASRRLYYQYTDERGRVRFTDQLHTVPAAWRDKVGFVELDAPPPGVTRSGERPQRVARSVSRIPQVVLYYADWCSNCVQAKRYLKREGIPFELRDVDNPSAMAEMVERTGQKGIPVIDVNGRILIGWDEQGLRKLLDAG